VASNNLIFAGGIGTSLINIVSDIALAREASGVAERSALWSLKGFMFSDPKLAALKTGGNLFAAGNMLTAVCSLTSAVIMTVDAANNPNKSQGGEIGAVGNLTSSGFLTALTIIATIQPEFAPFLFAAGLFMPNFSAIGAAVDYAAAASLLDSQGQTVYADILRSLKKIAILNSVPVVNFFSALYTSELEDELRGRMSENNNFLVWKAIDQFYKYELLTSPSAKEIIQGMSDAITQLMLGSDAIRITAIQADASQYYANNQTLNFATILDVGKGAPTADIRSAESNIPIINIVYDGSSLQSSISATVSGSKDIYINIDVSHFNAIDMTSKLNSFEIQKDNVRIAGNDKSNFYLDVGLVGSFKSIVLEAGTKTSRNFVYLQDQQGTIDALSFNLDDFEGLSIVGLYSPFLATSFITGTKSQETYYYGGGQDNVKMTGGDGMIEIGGAGSTVMMNGGHNTLEVQLIQNGLLSLGSTNGFALGLYDGGNDPNNSNIIDFSVTNQDDLFFCTNGQYTDVYAVAASNQSSFISFSQTITEASYIDGGKFTKFQTVHTGALNNYLDVDSAAGIQSLFLDGLGSNNLHLYSTNSIVDGTFQIYSSLVGDSAINLANVKIKTLMIVGRGGGLAIHTENLVGNLDLTLSNVGGVSSSLTESDGMSANHSTIQVDISNPSTNTTNPRTGKDTFSFDGQTTDIIKIENPGFSNVEVNELSLDGRLSSNTELLIVLGTLDNKIDFSSLFFNVNEAKTKLMVESHDGAGQPFLAINMSNTVDLKAISFSAGVNNQGYTIHANQLIEAMASIPTIGFTDNLAGAAGYVGGAAIIQYANSHFSSLVIA